jgi:membrane carboxypeptidase/penicillin-binding protein PbpC
VTPDAVVVVHPSPGDVFLVEPGYDRSTQSVELSAEVDPPVGEVRWLVDGREVSRNEWPYTGVWTLEPGEHQVVVVAGDRRSEPVSFAVR